MKRIPDSLVPTLKNIPLQLKRVTTQPRNVKGNCSNSCTLNNSEWQYLTSQYPAQLLSRINAKLSRIWKKQCNSNHKLNKPMLNKLLNWITQKYSIYSLRLGLIC